MKPPQSDALPFPGRDGRGVRVAVIDSGVNPRHPHIGTLAGGVSIPEEDGSYLDLLGHGTAVMAAIQEKAPGAEYFAVALFHAALRASTDGLLRAIEWSIENRMDVVNLSLGTRNARRANDFAKLVARAKECAMVLVAAREAEGQPCYPGCLAGVFGVGLDWECERNLYRVRESVFYASGYPRPAPGISIGRNLHGISFAVANMTGFIVRARQGRPVEALQSDLLTELNPSNSSAP
jgi:subtilisin family serine protease